MLDKIKTLLENNLSPEKVEVTDLTGTQDHLGLLVVSQQFAGKPLLAQHRLVMDVLKAEFQAKLHAVKIETYTPEAYAHKFSKSAE